MVDGWGGGGGRGMGRDSCNMGTYGGSSISSRAFMLRRARGFFSFAASSGVTRETAAFLTGEAADCTRL